MNILKKYFLFLFFSAITIVAGKAHAELYSTDALESYQNNIDALSDKDGSLLQLISELQSFRVFGTSGTSANTNVILPGYTSTATVKFVIARSSGNIATASTVTVSNQLSNSHGSGGSLILTSRLPGVEGNDIRFKFTQISSQPSNGGSNGLFDNGAPGTIQIVTTGTLVEIKLSTGDSQNGTAYHSSATMVCAAINSHLAVRSMVFCETVSPSTATIRPESFNTHLNSGSGVSVGSRIIPGSYAVDPSTSPDVVRLSTGANVVTTDWLEWWYLLKKR